MALIGPSILFAPSLATAAGAKQCRIIGTYNNRLVNPPFG